MNSRLFVAILALLGTGAARAQTPRPPDRDRPIAGVEWDLDTATAKVDTHLGRRALFLRGQSPPAFVSGLEFTDGTIEFDIAPMPVANFVGLVFRYGSPIEHENIYLRLHRSGSFEAMQYAPRLYTTAGIWQLTREFMAPVTYTPGAWTRVRVEVRGSRLEVFVGDSAQPTLSVPRMRGTLAKGRVGFWGRVNEKPQEWTAAISNVRVTPRPAVALATVADTGALPVGTLTGWQSAGPFVAADSSVAPPMPATGEWRPFPIEEHGLLNISRHFPKPPGGRHVLFLRNTIRVAAAQSVPLELSYSDDAMVWLNGQPLYRGANGFNGRYPGFLGFAAQPAEAVYLPLRAGTNELVVAVGERAFGWGLRARLGAALPSPAPTASCADHAEFDPWIGDWDVYRNGERVGRQVVTRALDGCAILVDWTGPSGDKGLGVLSYDGVAKAWTQTWNTNQVPFPSRPILRRQDKDYPGPGTRLLRVTDEFTTAGSVDRTTIIPLPGDRVRQVLEASRDGGRTWNTVFDVEQRRR